MTTERLYRKAERADDIVDLDLRDADPKEIIRATYETWLDAIKEARKGGEIGILYKEACRIVSPFKNKFSGTLRTSQAPTGNDVGLYLSALLNETNLAKLTIDTSMDNDYVCILGYLLQPGKSIGVLEGVRIRVGCVGYYAVGGEVTNKGEVQSMGECTEGGTFVNKCKVKIMGYGAKGGNWINEGEVESMGRCAEGGNFVNKGKVERMCKEAAGGNFFNDGEIEEMGDRAYGGNIVNVSKVGSMGQSARGGNFVNIGVVDQMGEQSHSGMWVNLGEANRMGCYRTEGGTFITTRRPKKGFLEDTAHDSSVRGSVLEELAGDVPLSNLLKELEHAAREQRFDDIEGMVRRVNERVRNMLVRKIA